MSVKIRMKVISKQQSAGYQKLEDGRIPHKEKISFEVVNTNDKTNPNFPYSFWSGGTKWDLETINPEAADQLQIGSEYDILISPAQN
jgi:hypothetical protein